MVILEEFTVNEWCCLVKDIIEWCDVKIHILLLVVLDLVLEANLALLQWTLALLVSGITVGLLALALGSLLNPALWTAAAR